MMKNKLVAIAAAATLLALPGCRGEREAEVEREGVVGERVEGREGVAVGEREGLEREGVEREGVVAGEREGLEREGVEREGVVREGD